MEGSALLRRAVVPTMVGAFFSVGASHADLPDEQSDVRGGAIAAVDIETGKELWRAKPTRDHVYQHLASGARLVFATEVPCAPGSPPRSADGRLNGERAALDARNGQPRWRSTGSANVVAFGPPDGQVDSGNVVIAASGSRVVGLSTRDGRRQWTRAGTVLGVTRSLVFVAHDRAAAEVRAVDRKSGKVRWTLRAGVDPTISGAIAVVAADDSTVIVAEGGSLRWDGPAIFRVFDAGTGAERSRLLAAAPVLFPLDVVPVLRHSAVVMVEGSIVFLDGDALVSRDLATGETRWARPAPQPRPAPPPRLAVSSDQHTVFTTFGFTTSSDVLAVDARTGADLWSVLDARFIASDSGVTVLGEVRLPGPDQPTRLDLRAVDTLTGEPIWDASLAALFAGEGFNLAFEPESATATAGRLFLASLCYEG